jgi:hypothetical protein
VTLFRGAKHDEPIGDSGRTSADIRADAVDERSRAIPSGQAHWRRY